MKVLLSCEGKEGGIKQNLSLFFKELRLAGYQTPTDVRVGKNYIKSQEYKAWVEDGQLIIIQRVHRVHQQKSEDKEEKRDERD